jgi:hypothetical protein
MTLTPMQLQLVDSWFKQKCPNHACPACGNRDWTTVDAVGLDVVRPVGLGQHSIGAGTSYPSVLRMCDHCAYLAHFLFSAITAGIASTVP